MNKVMLMGRMARDPEVKHTPNGTALVEFPLAVNERTKRSDGVWTDSVVFVDCKAFGKTAETIGEHCPKGHPIAVEGRLHVDTWEDKEGNRRFRMRVIVERMEFVPKSEGKPSQPKRETVTADTGDDIPF